MIRNFVYFAMLSAFVAMVWIALTIYHNITISSVEEPTASLAKPIFSTFNMEALESLKSRKQVAADLSQQPELVNINSLEGSELATPSAEESGLEIAPETVIPISITPFIEEEDFDL